MLNQARQASREGQRVYFYAAPAPNVLVGRLASPQTPALYTEGFYRLV